ncbi:hypothetical protein E2C01_038811 [Portunus trituberculatus]|uniref:Uncharacterized protein n=1 Tax=Portunus trituberculatus TaxID=210409 RepID=A0A5B7FI52_PORTR|nr:hypothetical protein [Portunus trituberculatus]
MRFSRREVVFYRLKIRSKSANVAEGNEEGEAREVSRHFGSPSREQSDLGIFLVSSPEGDCETGCGVNIFLKQTVCSGGSPASPLLSLSPAETQIH